MTAEAGRRARQDDAPPSPAAPEERVARPSYKKLKKRMKSDYKLVLRAVYAGRLPEEDLVRGFVADCHTMCTFPGKGDPLYPAFRAAADELQRAADAGDIEACAAAMQEIRRLWRQGHDEYK